MYLKNISLQQNSHNETVNLTPGFYKRLLWTLLSPPLGDLGGGSDLNSNYLGKTALFVGFLNRIKNQPGPLKTITAR